MDVQGRIFDVKIASALCAEMKMTCESPRRRREASFLASRQYVSGNNQATLLPECLEDVVALTGSVSRARLSDWPDGRETSAIRPSGGNRGHPLAGSLSSRTLLRPDENTIPTLLAECSSESHRFFTSWRRRIAPDTHQGDRQSAYDDCLSPWWRGHPRKALVPQRAHWICTILVVTRRLAPIHGWLALLAIRFAAHRGRRHDIPFNLRGVGPLNDEGLPAAVVTPVRSSEPRQMLSAPSACGITRGLACEPVYGGLPRLTQHEPAAQWPTYLNAVDNMPPSASARAPVGGRTGFTPRETEVLELLRLGLSNKVIAARLGIGLDTARRYSSRIKQKANILSAVAVPCVDIAHELDWLEQLDLHSLRLSDAERRVLRLLCQGYSSKHIARELDISPRTVDKHREHMLRKCRLRSTRQLAAWLASQYVKCGMAN